MDCSAFADEYPFESRYVEIDGQRLHYVDEGAGAVLLFVHGNPTWSFAWRNLIKDLRADYRVVALDHLGCGLSDKPPDAEYTLAGHIGRLVRFVESLDLEDVTLIAHDWGGPISLGAAMQLPQRFSRFVLCNTAAFRSKRIPLRIAVCRWPVVGTLAVRGLNAFSRAALSMAVAKTRLSPAVRAGYLAPYNSWAHRVAVHEFVKDIPMTPGHRSYETLVRIEEGLAQFEDRPVLLVWGMKDWCFTPWFLEEFERRFPKAESVRIEGAGHYVFEDAPDEMIAAIRGFLA